MTPANKGEWQAALRGGAGAAGGQVPAGGWLVAKDIFLWVVREEPDAPDLERLITGLMEDKTPKEMAAEERVTVATMQDRVARLKVLFTEAWLTGEMDAHVGAFPVRLSAGGVGAVACEDPAS